MNAKKKTTKTKENDTVAFQVRFDGDLHRKLKDAAEEAGISLNQLIQGICRGTSDNMYLGEAWLNREGNVETRPHEKCVFFGEPAECLTDEEWNMECQAQRREVDKYLTKGNLWFSLDFTNRGYVRGPRR